MTSIDSLVKEVTNLLTPRQLEILGLIAQERTDQEIAEICVVERNTVRTHKQRAKNMLGIRGQGSYALHVFALRYAVENRIELGFSGNADGLSTRESEVFQLIGEGSSNGNIAERLGISIFTVMTHVKNIGKKLRLDAGYTPLRVYAVWKAAIEPNLNRDGYSEASSVV